MTTVIENGYPKHIVKVHYLNRDSIILDGVKFWGSPVTRQVNRHTKWWAFETNSPTYEVPDDADILLMHQPPSCNGLGNTYLLDPCGMFEYSTDDTFIEIYLKYYFDDIVFQYKVHYWLKLIGRDCRLHYNHRTDPLLEPEDSEYYMYFKDDHDVYYRSR